MLQNMLCEPYFPFSIVGLTEIKPKTGQDFLTNIIYLFIYLFIYLSIMVSLTLTQDALCNLLNNTQWQEMLASSPEIF